MPNNDIENSTNKKKREKAGIFTSIFRWLLALFILLIAIGVIVMGINLVTNTSVKETFYQVGCSKVEDNIRIIQISDFHNSSLFGGNDVVVERVKKLKPDIIALTGDMIEENDTNYNAALDFCAKLAKIAPTYYIYGNNEIKKEYGFELTKTKLDALYPTEKYDPSESLSIVTQHNDLQRQLEGYGIKVLLNMGDTIQVGEDSVDIYGVLVSDRTSFWGYVSDDFIKYTNQNPDNLKIFLCHEPYALDVCFDEAPGDVLLCGHTHGGVVRIPGIGALYEHMYGLFPEKSGHHVYGESDFLDKTLIISSGLENRNFFRINNQPEIVIVDVNRY